MDKIKIIFSGISISIIFGLSFLFTKNALDYVEPFQFLAYRFSISFIFINILTLLNVFKIRKKLYKTLIPLVLLQPGLYFIFENYGVRLINVSEAGIIISTIPIFVAIFSRIFLKEKTHLSQLIFIFISFLGIIIIIGLNSITGNYLGTLLMFLAVLCATFYNILSRKLSIEYTPQEITYFMMFSGMIFYNIIFLISGNFNYSELLLTPVLISGLYLGILSSTITFFLINYMLSKITAVESSIFANLTTVISVIAGYLFRNEIILWYHIIGMVLIIIGVFGVNYIGSKKRKLAIIRTD